MSRETPDFAESTQQETKSNEDLEVEQKVVKKRKVIPTGSYAGDEI